MLISGAWILCLSTDSISINHCNIKIYMARHIMARFDMVSIRIPLGHKSIFNIHWSVCEKRKKIVGIISSLFLLFTIRMVNSIVLN